MTILVPMYIDYVPNRGSPPTILLRKSKRVGKKVIKTTFDNITSWPSEKIEALRKVLKGEPMVSANEVLITERSLPHGHVTAILGTMRKLGLFDIISSKPCKQRDLVIAMIAERLIRPVSKLSTTRYWHTSTLASELNIEDADENDLYAAMDWLMKRKTRIENKLAKRHLKDGSTVLYDSSNSQYLGCKCPLARFGNDKKGKCGKRVIVYGVMTDDGGRPVAVEVYPGNTGDPTTVPKQVDTLRKRFKLKRVVLTGDRGMLTQTQIDKLKDHPGIGWLSALRFTKIRKLADDKSIQPSLFDECNLAEILSPDFPSERLIVCRNPALAKERTRKRNELLDATEKKFLGIARQIVRRTKKPLTTVEIAKKVGRVENKYKMAKHFKTGIADGLFLFVRDEERIRKEEELDGIYVIRTSEPKERLSADDAVRGYKSLSHVERLIRTLKSVSILVSPIYHRLPIRVRSHIFVSTLAYYVEWHMRKSLKEILFDDEELDENRKTRDPVAPATPSEAAKEKKCKRQTKDGLPVHSFDTLMAELGTQCKNRQRIKSNPDIPPIFEITEPTPLQKRAFELLGLYPVN